MTETCILALRGVKLSYDIEDRKIEVLRGLDLEVHEEELVFIQGDLGAGKSALINVLAGLEAPEQGRIELGGLDVTEDAGRNPKPIFDSFVGCFAPWFRLESHLNAAEILFDCRRAPRLDPEAVLRILDIDIRDARPMGMLDAATRRRIDCARVLLTGPRVIVADLVTPPWGCAPELEAILRIHDELRIPVIATSSRDIEIAGARQLHLVEGRFSSGLACA